MGGARNYAYRHHRPGRITRMTTPSSIASRMPARDIHPVRDWHVLLAAAAVVLLASLAWNLSIFSQVAQGGTLSSAPRAPRTAGDIEAVARIFDERAQAQASYESPGRFADPAR